MLQFTKEKLERLQFVFETGGNNPKVTAHYHGLESIMTLTILQRRIKLTKKGRCNVFGEDGEYRGYITLNDNGMPVKHLPTIDGLTFNDFYEIGGDR